MIPNRDQKDIPPNFIEGVPEIHLEKRFGGSMRGIKINTRGVRSGFRAAFDADAQLMGRKAL